MAMNKYKEWEVFQKHGKAPRGRLLRRAEVEVCAPAAPGCPRPDDAVLRLQPHELIAAAIAQGGARRVARAPAVAWRWPLRAASTAV